MEVEFFKAKTAYSSTEYGKKCRESAGWCPSMQYSGTNVVYFLQVQEICDRCVNKSNSGLSLSTLHWVYPTNHLSRRLLCRNGEFFIRWIEKNSVESEAAPPGRFWRLVLPTRLSNSRRSFPSLFFSVLNNKQNVRAKNPDTINIPPFSGVGLEECACWRIYPAPALLNRLKSNQQKGRMFSFCGYHFRFAPLRNLFVFAWTLFVRRLFLWLQPKWSASRKQVRQRRKL